MHISQQKHRRQRPDAHQLCRLCRAKGSDSDPSNTPSRRHRSSTPVTHLRTHGAARSPLWRAFVRETKENPHQFTKPTTRACIYLQKVFVASCRAFAPDNKKTLLSREKLFTVQFLYQGSPIITTQMDGPCAIKPWVANVHSFSLSDTTDFLPSTEGFAVSLYWEHIVMFFPWQSLIPYRHSKTNQKYAYAHNKTHRPSSKYKVLDMMALYYKKKWIFSFSCRIIKYKPVIGQMWKYVSTGQSCRITHVWDKVSGSRWWAASKAAPHGAASKRSAQFLQDHLFHLSRDQEEFKQVYEKIIKTSFCSISITSLWHIIL